MVEARRKLAKAVEHAEADVALFRKAPTTAAQLPLGRFSDANVRSLVLRRLVLRLRLPLGLLAALATMGSGDIASTGSRFAIELAYWQRVKSLLTRREWAALTQGPVILMYHAIGVNGEKGSRYVLPESRFRRQLAWLRARGYHLISLCHLIETRAAGRLPPPRSVVVTFDDGYRDNDPALRRAGVPAAIFVVTGAVGGSNEWDDAGGLAGRPLLDWKEVRELFRAGVEVGAHTRTHPSLPEVPADRLEQEVLGSMEDLQRELGPGFYAFAYPHGRFNARTQAAISAAGFAGACCSRDGVNDPYVSQLELRRVEIKGTDSFAAFVLMVWLGRRITPLRFVRSLFVG